VAGIFSPVSGEISNSSGAGGRDIFTAKTKKKQVSRKRSLKHKIGGEKKRAYRFIFWITYKQNMTMEHTHPKNGRQYNLNKRMSGYCQEVRKEEKQLNEGNL
jgi:hypothetical protein